MKTGRAEIVVLVFIGRIKVGKFSVGPKKQITVGIVIRSFKLRQHGKRFDYGSVIGQEALIFAQLQRDIVIFFIVGAAECLH